MPGLTFVFANIFGWEIRRVTLHRWFRRQGDRVASGDLRWRWVPASGPPSCRRPPGQTWTTVNGPYQAFYTPYITNYTTQNSHITKTEGMYSIIRKKLYNKNICYTAYMVYNKLIYIYINVY